MLDHCELCPRCCGVNRLAGERGWCKAGRVTEVYRYAPHHGEEPPLSGSHGSGTVFFSRCTMACLYCQNYPWSQQGAGTLYEQPELEHAMRALAQHGCHNWNFVSPTPWMPMVQKALKTLRQEGFDLPAVCNTSGYERLEALAAYAEDIQIYLTNLRYASVETARAASAAPDYVEHARKALQWMWRHRGHLQLDKNGVALSGVICRILILPGLSHEAIANLEWIADTLGTDVPISVMSQYHPAWRAAGREPWKKTVSNEEYQHVSEVVASLGFENGWMQDVPDDATRSELLGQCMPPGGFDRTQ